MRKLSIAAALAVALVLAAPAGARHHVRAHAASANVGGCILHSYEPTETANGLAIYARGNLNCQGIGDVGSGEVGTLLQVQAPNGNWVYKTDVAGNICDAQSPVHNYQNVSVNGEGCSWTFGRHYRSDTIGDTSKAGGEVFSSSLNT